MIIPALDLSGGHVVRLKQGDFGQKTVFNVDPIKRIYDAANQGAQLIHIVDLDGAKSGEIKNLKTLERICSNTSLIVDFGGGVKSTDALEAAFNAGASFVTCGSIAVKNPTLVLSWLDKYSTKLILGADCKDRLIMTFGWLEKSECDVIDFISSWVEKGFKTCISTDISKDGMLSGPAFELYEDISKKIKGIDVIASGGISSFEDLLRLKKQNLYGAIVGKAYYEGGLTLEELKEAECLQNE